MEEILEGVKKLSVNDLRNQLQDLGIKVGPIIPTTQSIFQKKLAKKLYEQQNPETLPSECNTQEDAASGHVTVDVVDASKRTENLVGSEAFASKNGDEQINNDASVYYGVCPPAGISLEEMKEETFVFTDKVLALKAIKKFSGARFKCFKTKQEAETFSKQSPEDISSPWRSLSKNGNGSISTLGTGVSVESCPFKAPKAPELTKLRKAIEAGDVNLVESLIWDNPRFLISSGDTPVILQEGPRYNALHVSARSNQPVICQLILDTLEDPGFIDKLYGHTNETEATRTSRINFVVDLYLNTPDKGGCESPLHFACKHGFTEVVSVLISHPKTDKFMKNKYGETPRDVICSRVDNNSSEQEIRELMEGQFFVPLIRSEDNTTQPLIGSPWSPECTRGGVSLPPVSWSPKDPLMAVKACAGPMTPSKADLFHKRWNTPPSSSPQYVKKKFFTTKREDSEKGMERIGRELAQQMNVPWVEYWDFLQTYTDMTSEDGLDLLEEYLQKQSLALCIEEALGKLNLLSNSFHSFKYNQMDMSISRDQMGSMNCSWLTSPLADIQESVHEQESDIDLDKYLKGNIMDRYNTSSSTSDDSSLSDKMKKSVRMDESFNGPIKTIYDYGRMNQSMEWSMDSSGWSQDSFTGVITPMSCLTALFSKLSLIDRSRRQKRVGGTGGCFTVSCMGGGYPGYIKSTESEQRKRAEMNGSVIADIKKGSQFAESEQGKRTEMNGSVTGDVKKDPQVNGNIYIREPRLKLFKDTDNCGGSYETKDRNDNVEISEEDHKVLNTLHDVTQSAETEICDNRRDELKYDELCQDNEGNIATWRNDSQLSNTSTQDDKNLSLDNSISVSDDHVQSTTAEGSISERLNELVSDFDRKVNLSTKETQQHSELSQSVSESVSDEEEILSGDLKSEQSGDKKEFVTSTQDKKSCVDGQLNIVLELDKEKVPTTAFQSMYEILNERKSMESPEYGGKRRVIYSRDIVLDVSNNNLDELSYVYLCVAIVPSNSTVADMTMFARVPFFVNRSSFYESGDASPSRLPSMVDVDFNFGKDSISSALVVNNRSRGKIYFINGYQPSKTDLDVHRALQSEDIDKEIHPLVHRWKALVSSRMANPNCCWPSPARSNFHGNLSASFPQVSTPHKTPESPIVFYRSPIPRTPTRQKMSNTWSMPNIKAQLFPRSPVTEKR